MQIQGVEKNGQLLLMFDNVSPKKVTRLLVPLYGGSRNNRRGKTLPTMMEIARLTKGGLIAAFDFRGMNQGEDFSVSGLHTRVDDARANLTKLQDEYDPPEVVIVAESMGGYIASHLVDLLGKDDTLILVAPAAYDKKVVAEKIPFGSKFTEAIRREGSWQDSDAWDNMAGFNGKLLVLQWGADEVVPREIPQMYFDAATKAQGRTLITAQNFTHKSIFGTHEDGVNPNTPEFVALREIEGWLERVRLSRRSTRL